MANIAYVSKDDGSISIVNVDSNVVLATIPVGFTPIWIAITPDIKKAYLANEGGSSVTVIDLSNNTVIAVIPLGITNNTSNQPITILISQSGLAFTGNINGTISIINTTTDTLVKTLIVGYNLSQMIFSPDGKYIYATTGMSVSVISTVNLTVLNMIPTPNFSSGLDITPDGSRLYVAISGVYLNPDNRVAVIDTVTSAITSIIIVGTRPTKVNINTIGTRVYVVNVNSNSVSVIDIATNNVIATVPVGNVPNVQVITPDGSRDYVISLSPGQITAINTSINSTTPLDVASPLNMVVTPDSSKLIVTTGTNNIAVIDTATNTLIIPINVGASSSFIMLAPQGTSLKEVVYTTGVIMNQENGVNLTQSVYVNVLNESYLDNAVIEVNAFAIFNFTSTKYPTDHHLYVVPSNTADMKQVNVSEASAYEIQIKVSGQSLPNVVLSVYGVDSKGNVVPGQRELQGILTVIPQLSYSP